LNGCGGGVSGSHETRLRKEWPTLHKNHEGLGHPRSKDKVKINPRVKGDPPATSAAGVGFIKGWEGWNGKYDKESGKWLPKDDGFGNGTIGWGHNCGKCEDFKGGITKEQGDALLKKDLGQFEKAVNGLGAKLSQPQFDALVSFAFNVRSFAGSGLFSNVASGAAVTKGNFTDYGHARKNGKLVEVPGLIKRRASEYNLYSNGVYDSRH
jgi:lysozyme